MADSLFRINRGISLNPQASAPANPANGDMYYDSTRNSLVEYVNGNWRDVQSRSDVASAASLTSTQFTASIVQSSVARVTGSTASAIHGMAAGSDAKYVSIYNQSSATATIKNASATEGTAANRILTPSGGDIFLYPGQSAVLGYDSAQSRWVVFSQPKSNSVATDSSTTGTTTTLGAFATDVIRLTNASLVSLAGIPAGFSGQDLVIENKTGNQIFINNEDAGATAANRIQTGTSLNVPMANNATFVFMYDSTSSRWQIKGGTGSGTGAGSKNYLSAITTSLGGATANSGNGNFEYGNTNGWSLFNTTLGYTFSSTFTVTIASPAVFTTPAAHGLNVGDSVVLSTTGALPTGLTAATTYFVSAIPSTTTFNVSAATALTSNVNTTGTQSGTHTVKAYASPSGAISAGAASVTTFNTVSTSQLAGAYSLQTASSAAWAAGQGFISDAFFIDTEDQGKVLSFKGYYQVVANPSNGYFPGNINNTFAIAIYDVTNSVWIQPPGGFGITQNSGVGYVTGQFQSSSNGTQYRIALIALNASVGAITMYWDDFVVGPQTAPLGAPISDWTAYIPTFSAGFGAVTNIAYFWRRNGGNLEVQGSHTNGTTTATIGSISLPAGLSLDTTKIVINNTTAAAGLRVGRSQGTGSASAQAEMVTATGTSTTLVYTGGGSTSTTELIPSGANGSGLSGGVHSLSFIVPIAGWSSNVQMSSDTDTRVCAARVHTTVVRAVANNTIVPLQMDTTDYDTHGAISTVGSITRFTAPLSGFYQVSAAIGLSVASQSQDGFFEVIIRVNGSVYSYTKHFGSNVGTDNLGGGAADIIKLNAGDFVELAAFQNSGPSRNTSNDNSTYFAIHRVTGPASIAANELVAASYFVSANFAASTTIPINFDTKEFDSHGAVTPSATAWKFTAPVAGTYLVTMLIGATATSTAVLIYKNGVAYKSIGNMDPAASTSEAGTGIIKLNAGDFIDIRPNNSNTATGGTLATASTSNIAITRIGF